ncbi:PulJ/GspJ family protein [Synechococcus sp. CCY9201]|uniref:PulJ/GspJ family protein n=1 Tax=Synechococcus sp. CCY9201 TaxID=174697 RepID=UPI003A4C5F79
MKHPSLSSRSIGFTLVELLVGMVIAGVAITAAAQVHVSHIRTSGASVTSGQLQKDLGRLQRLLQTEIEEACLLQAGTTSPTTCAQACTATGGSEVRLLVPLARDS